MMNQFGIDGIDLNKVVKFAMEKYEINPNHNVQVDYWSRQSQTYILCGCMDP